MHVSVLCFWNISSQHPETNLFCYVYMYENEERKSLLCILQFLIVFIPFVEIKLDGACKTHFFNMMCRRIHKTKQEKKTRPEREQQKKKNIEKMKPNRPTLVYVCVNQIHSKLTNICLLNVARFILHFIFFFLLFFNTKCQLEIVFYLFYGMS